MRSPKFGLGLAPVEHKIKIRNMNMQESKRKTKEKDQKISYAFFGTDKTQLDDF